MPDRECRSLIAAQHIPGNERSASASHLPHPVSLIAMMARIILRSSHFGPWQHKKLQQHCRSAFSFMTAIQMAA
jgi:hypothetical protein